MDFMHTVVSKGGRVVVPVALREKFGIEEGDELTVTYDELGIRMITPEMAMKYLQKRAGELVPKHKKGKIVDEFIDERQKEFEREQQSTAT